jgi:hypothetical protein
MAIIAARKDFMTAPVKMLLHPLPTMLSYKAGFAYTRF